MLNSPLTRQPTRTVRSAGGEEVRLERRLAAGGQGEVWLVEGGRCVAKIFRPSMVDQLGVEVARERLRRLMSLPLEGLDVCRPTGLLAEPEFGYFTDYLAGHEPISTLMAPPPDTNPTMWWHDTGGLRRRVRLLASVADTLRQLHARGLVYGDLSESNVLVHTNSTSDVATLIDLDNVVHHGRGRHVIHTPWFGAPELIRGDAAPSWMTDAWSFAVLVSWCLQLTHPFMGSAVMDDGSHEAALRGELPWVDDPADRSNERIGGLPQETVLTVGLLKLLRRTFGEEGRRTPASRPAMFEWADALFGLGDRTLHCRVCGLSFNSGSTRCPWCGNARPRHALLQLYRWLPGGQRSVVRIVGSGICLDLTSGVTTLVPRRLSDGSSGECKHEGVVRVRSGRNGLEVSAVPRSNVEVRLRASGSDSALPLTTRYVRFDPSVHRLHFGPMNRPHRVAMIEVVED